MRQWQRSLQGEESVKLDVFTTFGEMAHAAVTKAIPECHGVEIRL